MDISKQLFIVYFCSVTHLNPCQIWWIWNF